MMIISPSVLSLDYSRMEQQIQELEKSDAQWLHFDVMDGHFVKNLTFGTDILKGFRKASKKYMDVHVMIEEPAYYAKSFILAGADNYTFHYEVMKSKEDIKALAKFLHEQQISAGLSIKPDTPLEVLDDFLNDFDLFLIMSVQPGFGGQSFIPESLERIMNLKKKLQEVQSKAKIEVDGGINKETGLACKKAGADILVAGSYIFKNNIVEAVKSLE